MKKILYNIFYRDEGCEGLSNLLMVSNEDKAREESEKMLRNKGIKVTERPVINGHRYVDGYRIEILSESLSDTLKKLEQCANRYTDLSSKIGYLEALRDLQKEINIDWKDEEKEKKEKSEIETSQFLSKNRLLMYSNVPAGYDNEGNRM